MNDEDNVGSSTSTERHSRMYGDRVVPLFGGIVPEGDRNDDLVARLREMLAEAEDGAIVSAAIAVIRRDQSGTGCCICSGGTEQQMLGAVTMLQAQMTMRMLGSDE